MPDTKIPLKHRVRSPVRRLFVWSTIALQTLCPVLPAFTPVIAAATQSSVAMVEKGAVQDISDGLSPVAAQAGESAGNRQLGSFASGYVTGKATREVEEWLRGYGNARIQ
ncbi:TPA: hypothetical protein ACGPGH_004658, partial [Escherichia coli]